MDGLRVFVQRHIRKIAPLLALCLLVAFFSIFSGGFLTTRNFLNILSQTSVILILTTAVTFSLLLGEIDLSFANLATMTGVVMALLVSLGFSPLTAVFLAALSGLGVGLINGFVIAYIGVPSFLATLAMMQLTSGLSIYTTKSRPLFDVPATIEWIGNGSIAGIPMIAIVSLLIAAISEFVLVYTTFGRHVYMVGSNREAARLSGVNVRRVVFWTFLIVGFLSGLGGIVGTGRLGTAQTGNFTDLLIGALSATVLGGTPLTGGKGGITNAVIGAFIWIVLSNGLNLMGDLSIYIKTLITGSVLLAALIFNVYLHHIASE